ncbi:MAG TPA: RNA polymerase sigma factor [bacterium]|nr:RNA polymerase sigma factor [bacterium]HPJ71105.1 RNA polymerase sigma factor [bacterium]HPQ65444.1 RNA polymerase sigma factor [bacterium]
MELTEAELIGRFRAGEEDAFEALMKLFEDRTLSLAWYLTGNRDDAMDITQEAFIRMYRVLPRWEPKASLFTWLYRVVVNLTRDRGRRLAREGRVGLEEVPETADRRTDTSPGGALGDEEIGRHIRSAVSRLPRRQREAFVLRHYQECTIREIAEIQGCSEGAVKANLFHAVRKLRRLLRDFYAGAPGET